MRKTSRARRLSGLRLKCRENAGESLHGQAGHPYRILVVDDEPDIRRLNAEVLADSGYLVDVVDDGAAAWEALHHNSYDLLITDNEMPRMSGVELLEKLHQDRKFLPVIMATGTLPPDDLNHQPWLSVVTTLLKPYTLAELVVTVKNSLRVPFSHVAAL